MEHKLNSKEKHNLSWMVSPHQIQAQNQSPFMRNQWLNRIKLLLSLFILHFLFTKHHI